MQGDQSDIHQQCGENSLKNTDGDGLCTGGLQLAQAEFIADGKGDKTQSGLGDDFHGSNLGKGLISQPGDVDATQTEWSQQKACYQIGGNSRKMHPLG